MEIKTFNIDSTVYSTVYKQFVTIIDKQEDYYHVVYWVSNSGNPFAENAWVHCDTLYLKKEDVEETFYLIQPKKVVAWYAYEVKAKSKEEALQKLKDGEYEDSCLMGIDTDFESEVLEDENLVKDIEEWEYQQYGYPNTNGYYKA
jgi:hypothetical protein